MAFDTYYLTKDEAAQLRHSLLATERQLRRTVWLFMAAIVVMTMTSVMALLTVGLAMKTHEVRPTPAQVSITKDQERIR